MYRNTAVAILLLLLLFPACSNNTDQDRTLTKFLSEYRKAKSVEQVLSGEVYTKKMREMWTPDFSAFDNSSEHSYLILDDNFKVIKVEYLGKKTYDTTKKLKGDSFFIDIEENIVAEYQSGRRISETNKIYSVTYWIIVTDTGPKIQGDPMLTDFAILKSDENKLKFYQKE